MRGILDLTILRRLTDVVPEYLVPEYLVPEYLVLE
jgi:hypothetical protein